MVISVGLCCARELRMAVDMDEWEGGIVVGFRIVGLEISGLELNQPRTLNLKS